MTPTAAVLGALVGLYAGSALAQRVEVIERTAVARAGRATKVAASTRLDASCNGMEPPEVRVVEAPGHGTVTIRKTVNRMVEREGSTNRCVGTTAEGLGLFYTPRQGFTGPDRLRYTSQVPGHLIRSYTVTIDVQ